jgi:hypothetical protein
VDIDETALGRLIGESRGTRADALRSAGEPLRDLADLGRQAGGGGDVQVLRTASAIEVVAVSTYKTALGLPYVGGGGANAFIKLFAKTTMLQHSDHLDAFQAATTALGGVRQDKPEPVIAATVDAVVKSLGKATAAQGTQLVLALALELENIAAQTYVHNMSQLTTANAKKLTASVMSIEAQHAAVLTAAQTLLKAGDGAGLRLSVTAASLPAAVGSAGFPAAFCPTSKAVPAGQGAG